MPKQRDLTVRISEAAKVALCEEYTDLVRQATVNQMRNPKNPSNYLKGLEHGCRTAARALGLNNAELNAALMIGQEKARKERS